MKFKLTIFMLYLMTSSLSLGSYCTPFAGINMDDDNLVEEALENVTFEKLASCTAEDTKSIEDKLATYTQNKRCQQTNFMKSAKIIYQALIKKESPGKLLVFAEDIFLYNSPSKGKIFLAPFFERVFTLLINGIKQNIAPAILHAKQKEALKKLCITILDKYTPKLSAEMQGIMGRRKAMTGQVNIFKKVKETLQAMIKSDDYKKVSHLIQAYVTPISNVLKTTNTEMPAFVAILTDTPLDELHTQLEDFYAAHSEFVAQNQETILQNIISILSVRIGIEAYGNALSDEEVTDFSAMLTATLHFNINQFTTQIIRERNTKRHPLVKQIESQIKTLAHAASIPATLQTYPFLTADQSFTKFKNLIVRIITSNDNYLALIDQLTALFGWSEAQKQELTDAITAKRQEEAEAKQQQEAAEKAERERQEQIIAAVLAKMKPFIQGKMLTATPNSLYYKKVIKIIDQAGVEGVKANITNPETIESLIIKLYQETIEILNSELASKPDLPNQQRRRDIIKQQFEKRFPDIVFP